MQFRALLEGPDVPTERPHQSFATTRAGINAWVTALLKMYPKATATIFETTEKQIDTVKGEQVEEAKAESAISGEAAGGGE